MWALISSYYTLENAYRMPFPTHLRLWTVRSGLFAKDELFTSRSSRVGALILTAVEVFLMGVAAFWVYPSSDRYR